MRKLYVFGNGLGRALSNEDYSLSRALQSAWDDNAVLSLEQKQLIHQCLPEDVIENDILVAPQGEEQLDKLQRVLAACDEISKVEVAGGVGWLYRVSNSAFSGTSKTQIRIQRFSHS